MPPRKRLGNLWASIWANPAPKRKRPNEVFTPRSKNVNPAMYVSRPELERALRSGLEAGFHIVIRGQSGRGKSWLYQKCLEDRNIYLASCNLSTAARLGSIAKEFANFLANAGVSINSEKETTGNLTAGPLGGGLKQAKKFFEPDLFRLVLEECRRQAGERQAVLVLDNLEEIVQSPELLRELASIITLLDDRIYAQSNVRLIIVGATESFLSYYKGEPNLPTISSRIRELPEVSSLTEEQCHNLSMQGLVTELGFQLPVEIQTEVLRHISAVTGRVPLYIHEYCLELARLAEENDGAISLDLLNLADHYYDGGRPAEPNRPELTQPKPAPKPLPTPAPKPLPTPAPKPLPAKAAEPSEPPEKKKRQPSKWPRLVFRVLGWLMVFFFVTVATLYLLLYAYFRFVF